MATDSYPAKRKANRLPWAGFLLTLVAFASYPLFLYRFPVTRDVPWVNFLLFAAALALLVAGLRRAFARPAVYRGRIAAPILAALSVVLLGLFCFGVFVGSRDLPISANAPKVGQKAPDFTLPDANGRQTSLAELLTAPSGRGGAVHPPRGVLLIFYRGYW